MLVQPSYPPGDQLADRRSLSLSSGSESGASGPVPACPAPRTPHVASACRARAGPAPGHYQRRDLRRLSVGAQAWPLWKAGARDCWEDTGRRILGYSGHSSPIAVVGLSAAASAGFRRVALPSPMPTPTPPTIGREGALGSSSYWPRWHRGWSLHRARLKMNGQRPSAGSRNING